MWKSSIGRLAAVSGVLFIFFVIAAPVAMIATPVAHAAKADNATEMKAREAFAAGRYDEALELFAKLYAQTLHPVYLRNIGRCHQKLRQPDKAIDKFREYLAKEKKISADERKEIDGYIKEMEALRDEQAHQATPPPNNLPPPMVTPINNYPNNNYPNNNYPNNNYPNNPNPPPPNYYPPPPTTSGTLVAQPPPPQQEEAPIYKKWWFWTGIGAVVVVSVVTVVLLTSTGGTDRPACTATECM